MSEKIEKQLAEISEVYEKKIISCISVTELEKIQIELLGRKSGIITDLISQIPSFTIEERKIYGPKINSLKLHFIDLIAKKERKLAQKTVFEIFDPGMPGEKIDIGHLHPITQVRMEAESIFEMMGFTIVEPHEIDDDYHVFETLNIPPGHPARDMWDTFWTDNNQIPITHTSSMQNRILKQAKPPIRAIVPGRCFRHEATDARHEHTFYQIEGIYVDKNITLANLIGTLLTFLKTYFQKDLRYKIQPSYFPFVEPGLEFLISCVLCDGRGCSTCGKSGWLELVPCGPIHPRVMEMGGLDPAEFSGFAWGMGLDRLVMLKYAIEDIRLFHSGDLRFLNQF